MIIVAIVSACLFGCKDQTTGFKFENQIDVPVIVKIWQGDIFVGEIKGLPPNAGILLELPSGVYELRYTGAGCYPVYLEETLMRGHIDTIVMDQKIPIGENREPSSAR